MKTFGNLIRFIDQKKISIGTPILVAYRQSSLADVQYFKLIISGNSIVATDNENNNDIQFKIETVENFIDLIQSSQEDSSNRYMTFRTMVVPNLNRNIGITVTINQTFKTGFSVSDFIQEDNGLILDLSI